ncbi:MAG: phage tail sheath subtilisin-like domain-containing protein, partial [Anaerolineae bacterium]|nr:phage tail sheath subtilisin-like domain-containing protein [Anaerolineae bacterium]
DSTVTNPAAPAGNGKAFEMPFLPGSTTTRYTLTPVNQVELVTNWEQFKNKFGDFHTGNLTLAHAVYGFFNNGGSRCYVVRVNSLTTATDLDTALARFEAIDEIALVAAPGATVAATQKKLIDHCEGLKDRFAILDGQVTTTITDTAIRGTVSPNKDGYAAMYFPRIQVSDPVSKSEIFVPPSGHMAGVYARTDAERGVHKAPANTNIRGVIGLEYQVTKNEQEGLNPKGINVIRSFEGTILVWGERTLGGDDNGEYKYINVRRLMNFLRESIEEGTRFAVFEPNAQPLWQRITRAVTAFLTIVWRDGALVGSTAEEAFYVKCDAATNPPEVRDAGQMVCEIGVAIVRPAEFVIFRISQLSGPASS